MGGSDDDSDSDTNVDVKEGSTVAAAVRVQVAPAPVAPSLPQTAPQPQSGAPSDLSMRLKSLYSPAAKQPQAARQGQPPAQQAAPTIAPPQQQQQQQQMQQQQQHTQQQQQRMPSTAVPMQPQPMQHQRIPPPSQQQAAPRMGNPLHPPSSRPQNDPFAPTPVSEIMQKAHNYNAQHHLVPSPHANNAARPIPPVAQQAPAPPAAANTANSFNTQKELELKRQKQRFVLFTQNLIKILKVQDPALHERVGAVIKDCTARNKRQEPGYESVTVSMQRHLREIVNDNYWKQAQHATAASFAKAREKQQQQQAAPASRTPLASSTASTTSSQPMSLSQNSQTTPPMNADERAAHERRQKETFQLFLKILVKVLKDKDPPMFNRVNTIMRECAERNKRHEPGYESVTASVKARLKAVVSNSYIEEAKRLTAKYQAQQRNQQQQQQQQQQAVPTQMAQVPQRPGVAPATKPQPTTQQQPVPNQSAKTKRPSLSTTANSTKASAAPAKATASSVGKSTGKTTGKRPKSAPPARKPSITGASSEKAKAPSASLPAANFVDPQMPPPVREYSEFMEMVHHAVNFDWTTAGLALGADSLTQLPQEQQDLLLNTAQIKAPVATVFPCPGWGDRNVVSVRTAWARVHLHEVTLKKNNLAALTTTTEATNSTANWKNEATAELQEPVLAALSEGVQQYLTTVLEKALHCARQRYNVDGIRLWHQQLTAADEKEPNPLSLRLGSDVSRQWAQAQGNAAMTVKRMEEALERQSGVPSYERELTTETISNSTSMAELSLRPALSSKAIDAVDYHAKRSFEIYGGKEAGEPSLGRVPKRGKIEVDDFLVAQHLGTPHHHHRAAMISNATAFF